VPAVTSVTRVASTLYLQRYLVTTDGTDPATIIVPNADLMSGPLSMTRGYLKTLWDRTYLTQAAARAALLEDSQTRCYSQVRDTFPAFAVDVDVGVDLRPFMVLIFPIKDFPISIYVSFEYRHSQVR
jgi:hypothetical protein